MTRAAKRTVRKGHDSPTSHHRFSNSQSSGTGSTGYTTDDNGQTTGIDVTLSAGQFSRDDAGASLSAGVTVVHEGSHIAHYEAQWGAELLGVGAASSSNITQLESEIRAYLTGASYLGEEPDSIICGFLNGRALDTPSSSVLYC